MHRYGKVILVILLPLLLVSFVLFLLRSPNDGVLPINRKLLANYVLQIDQSSNTYAVIFDAGSSGSRVHGFCFDQNLDLVYIGEEIELFEQATAGLRMLGDVASENILQAVRDLLKTKSTFKTEDDWVTVLDGSQEGSYLWIAINYLLKNIGKDYSETVGVVDLGGGSVQMAYAISEADAAKAPMVAQGEDPYVKELSLLGAKYYLYVHSYLNYGLLAARAEILGLAKDADNPCILTGYNGVYTCGGIEYKVSAPSSGSNMNKCRKEALKALKVNESTCTYTKCTFGGVWNGGGGDGQNNMYVGSYFYDRAAQVGFINASEHVVEVRPQDFKVAAKHACQTTFEDAKPTYPNVEADDLPYLCMDLVYQYTLLVDGFDMQPRKHITLVKQIKYQDSLVEAAWPLGRAIEAVSSNNALEAVS